MLNANVVNGLELSSHFSYEAIKVQAQAKTKVVYKFYS